MALFTNFVVESETHHAITAIAQRFAGVSLVVEGVEVPIEHSGVFENKENGWWYFHADPGYNNGWHSLPSLNTARAFTAVGEAFYAHLPGSPAFRRALFAYEALDSLACNPEDLWCFDYPGLIVREELVRDPSLLDRSRKVFDGYLQIGKVWSAVFVDYEANPAKYKMPPSQSPPPAPGRSPSSPP